MANYAILSEAGKVHSRSDDVEDSVAVDHTDYPFLGFQPLSSFNGVSPEKDDNFNRQSRMNSTDRPCRVSKCKVTVKDDINQENAEKNGENSLKSSESAQFCDFIKELKLRTDDGSDKETENDMEENDSVFEDEDTGEVASIDYDEEDETAVPRNPLCEFLYTSTLFIRNIIRGPHNRDEE